MIEVLFARLHQLTNKLRRIANYTTQTTYGTGQLGNWYVGIASDDLNVPETYNHVLTHAEGGMVYMPYYPSYEFDNLTIDTGATLRLQGDTAVIRVKDTLILNGTISFSNCHPGGAYATNCGTTWSANHMYGSTHILPETGFIVTGGSGQGGVCVIYYHQLLNSKGNISSSLNWASHTLLSGGSSTSEWGGGYLVLIVKKCLMGTSGYIDVRGGSGAGIVAPGILMDYQMKEAKI